MWEKLVMLIRALLDYRRNLENSAWRTPNSYGTLSAELFAARSQADLIRTHDPGAFRDAWEVERRLARK
jgi:hypothetical protein